LIRVALSSRLSARLAWVPWLSLGFLLTGCPLSDHYTIVSDANGGDANAGGDAGSAGGSTIGGLGGGVSGAGAADAGSANGAAQNAGNGGTAGGTANGASGEAGAAELAGAAGQEQSGGGAGTGGSVGTSGASGSGGDSGSSGSSAASGAGGGAGCSISTCSYTCCAASGGGSALTCADTTRDFQNCGACGTLCNAGRSCASSRCSAGWVGISVPPVGFAARWRAASVAMGKSVFIWGGSDSSGAVLDSGAIYSPATDSWALVPKDAQTPTARVLASAVWTGSVVVVFGGSDATGATPYNDGAVYDPAKNAWVSIPTAGKARSSALAFWDGSRAVFWGGIGAAGAAVSGADRFDLATWSSSSVVGDPGAILNPAAAWYGATLYLEGGLIAGARTDKVSSYTSDTDAWASPSKNLAARSNAFGAWDGAGFVVWGGRDDFGLRNDGKYLTGGNWSPLSTSGAPSSRMAVPRRHGWMFETSPGRLALFGGQTSLTGQGTFTTTGATYDMVGSKWAAVPAWPSGEAHDYGVAVWTGDEFVLWGGRTGGGTSPSATLTGERWAR